MSTTIDEQVQDIITDARKTFDLSDTVKNRKQRTDEITVFGDEREIDDQPGEYETDPESALTFHLRAVPELIVKDCKRKARAAYILGDGTLPTDKVDEFGSLFTAYLLSAMVVKVVNAQGAVAPSMDVERAAEMENYLPEPEFRRLDLALSKLQFKAAVAHQATTDADF